MVGKTDKRGGMGEVPGRLRSCSSSPMWHHITATSSLISGFSFGVKDPLKHCCPHSSSVGGSKVDTSTLHPKVGATTRVPRVTMLVIPFLPKISFDSCTVKLLQAQPLSCCCQSLLRCIPAPVGVERLHPSHPAELFPSGALLQGLGVAASPSSAARASPGDVPRNS